MFATLATAIFALMLFSCSDNATFETIEPGQGATLGQNGDATGLPSGTSDAIAGNNASSSSPNDGDGANAGNGNGNGDGANDGNGDGDGANDGNGDGTNDGAGDGDGDGAGDGAGDGPDPEEIKLLCESFPIKTLEQRFLFEDPKSVCAWGKNGNLSEMNAVIRARREQEVELDLDFASDEKVVVCDLDFNFPKQEIYYDDEIFLTFNNVILTSSIDYSKLFDAQGDLPIYSWEKIKGFGPYTAKEKNPFCLGEKDGLGKCQLPFTQSTGDLELSFDKSLIYKISAASGLDYGKKTNKDEDLDLSGKAKFKLITVGDNDSNDCRHTDINFEVSVNYVVIPK